MKQLDVAVAISDPHFIETDLIQSLDPVEQSNSHMLIGSLDEAALKYLFAHKLILSIFNRFSLRWAWGSNILN
jgi:hypothetical protein